MGGGEGDHGEGGHKEPFRVPSYKEFIGIEKVSPELMEHEQRLAGMGLKDPWIRNYSWKYDPKRPEQFDVMSKWRYWYLMKHSLFRGFWYGLGIAAIICAGDEAYLWYNYKYTTWNRPHHLEPRKKYIPDD